MLVRARPASQLLVQKRAIHHTKQPTVLSDIPRSILPISLISLSLSRAYALDLNGVIGHSCIVDNHLPLAFIINDNLLRDTHQGNMRNEWICMHAFCVRFRGPQLQQYVICASNKWIIRPSHGCKVDDLKIRRITHCETSKLVGGSRVGDMFGPEPVQIAELQDTNVEVDYHRTSTGAGSG